MEEDAKKRTDVSAAARIELGAIRFMAKKATSNYRPGIERYHLIDIVALVDELLDSE